MAAYQSPKWHQQQYFQQIAANMAREAMRQVKHDQAVAELATNAFKASKQQQSAIQAWKGRQAMISGASPLTTGTYTFTGPNTFIGNGIALGFSSNVYIDSKTGQIVSQPAKPRVIRTAYGDERASKKEVTIIQRGY